MMLSESHEVEGMNVRPGVGEAHALAESRNKVASKRLSRIIIAVGIGADGVRGYTLSSLLYLMTYSIRVILVQKQC
jgi:hypothetical protein